MIENVSRSSCEVPGILVRLKKKNNFLKRFWKSTQMSNFMKIRPVEAEFFHADGQTDMTKLIVAFRNSAKAPKNRVYFPC